MTKNISREKLENALQNALAKIESATADYKDCFPTAASVDGVYGKSQNTGGWTQSFWTGMLWLAYEMTGKEVFLDTVK